MNNIEGIINKAFDFFTSIEVGNSISYYEIFLYSSNIKLGLDYDFNESHIIMNRFKDKCRKENIKIASPNKGENIGLPWFGSIYRKK